MFQTWNDVWLAFLPRDDGSLDFGSAAANELTGPGGSRSVRVVSESPEPSVPPSDASSGDAVSGAAASAPEASASRPPGTAWELVRRLKSEGATREVMLAKLKETGLGDEEAKVLVNSVAGALPAELPSAQLTGGNDLLAPSVFTLSDIGLTGPPTLVGLYWMGFGVAILIALGLGWLLTAAGLAELPEHVGEYAVRIGGVAASTFLVWGAYRYSQGITIRRKP